MTARGPAFKKGYISPSFDNIQLYYLEAGKIMCSNYSLLHVVRVILDVVRVILDVVRVILDVVRVILHVVRVILHVVRVILDQPGYTKILYLHCLQVSDVREHVNRVSLTS